MKHYLVPMFAIVAAETAEEAIRDATFMARHGDQDQHCTDALYIDEVLEPGEFDPETDPHTITDCVPVPFRTGVEDALTKLLKDAECQIHLVGQAVTTSQPIPDNAVAILGGVAKRLRGALKGVFDEPDRDDKGDTGGVLTLSEDDPNAGNDYTLRDGSDSVWITVDDISVYVVRGGGVVSVDLTRHFDECGGSLGSCTAKVGP